MLQKAKAKQLIIGASLENDASGNRQNLSGSATRETTKKININTLFAKSYIKCLKQVKGSQMSENWDEKVWQPTSTDTKSMLDAKFCPETISF